MAAAKVLKRTQWCCLDVSELIAKVRALPRSHQDKVGTFQFKRQAEDFQVDEVLGFELSGAGEHLWLQVCKTGINTNDVVRRLAQAAGIAARDIGFAGLKDRHGVCRQWLSLHLPGRKDDTLPPELQAGYCWPDGALTIDAAHWNHRKLRRGSHRANQFRIRLYSDTPLTIADMSAIEERLRVIGRYGVPNYFGEQRFGFDNLNKAARWFAGTGPRPRRSEQGMLLSAARSALFNAVLARRVSDATWNRYIAGDVLNLDGTGSVFVAEPEDAQIAQRMATGDVHPTGPLWGRGELASLADARELEESVLRDWTLFREGLERAGLEQQRRSLRLPVQALHYRFFSAQLSVDSSNRTQDSEPNTGLELTFTLPTGCYATAVLHEFMASRPLTSEPEPHSDGAKQSGPAA